MNRGLRIAIADGLAEAQATTRNGKPTRLISPMEELKRIKKLTGIRRRNPEAKSHRGDEATHRTRPKWARKPAGGKLKSENKTEWIRGAISSAISGPGKFAHKSLGKIYRQTVTSLL